MTAQTERFITFEGGEGAGKSTQVRLLHEKLVQAGQNCVVTREPGGTPFAEALRAFILSADTPPHAPFAEALLFSAARADHVEKVIAPALASGAWVLCDRFADSTRAYQGAAGDVDGERLAALERLVVDDLRPGLTIILDIPAADGLARARARAANSGDAYESRDIAFHERLRQGFLDIAAAEPGRCVVIDGGQDEQEIARQIWSLIAKRSETGERA